MNKRWILLLSAALLMAGEPGTFQFEKEAHAIAKGRSPKFLARRTHGLLGLYTAPSPGGKGFDLFLTSSSDVGDTFTPPQRINNVPGEVSDHGENSPSLLFSPDEATLYAVWNARDPKNPSGTHLRFSRSAAMTPKWSDAITIDDDPEPNSHSFHGAAVGPDGTIYAAWLDGRERKSEHGMDHAKGHGKAEMDHTGGTSAIYLTRSMDGGKTFEKNVRVTGKVCPCCRVSIGFVGNRVIVGWRQVDTGDVRDVYVAASSDRGGTWGKPVAVARDNWKINGCPHVGPSLASLNGTLYVSWFSEGGGKPGIYAATSKNGGESFTPKRLLSEGTSDPTHPAIAATEDKVALVFQARDTSHDAGWGKMGVYYREIYSDGSLSPLVRAGEGKTGASFPSVALGLSGRIFVGWTEAGGEDGSKVYLVRGRALRQTATLR